MPRAHVHSRVARVRQVSDTRGESASHSFASKSAQFPISDLLEKQALVNPDVGPGTHSLACSLWLAACGL